MVLNWRTHSEINNLGFVLLRASGDSAFKQLASYDQHPLLKGAGTTTLPHQYQWKDPSATPLQHYLYQLHSVDTNGHQYLLATLSIHTGAATILPTMLELAHPYPNPFNGTTTILLEVPPDAAQTPATLQIVNLQGQPIVTFYREKPLTAGFHRLSWNGRTDMGKTVPSGIYFVVLSLPSGNVLTRKLVYIK